MSALTPKQEAFCKAYVLYGNASEAYRQSYNVEKSTPKTINESASKLLADPKISARVAELQAGLQKNFEVTATRVQEEYAKIAFFDPRRMFQHGDLIPVSDMDAETAAALAGFDVVTTLDGTTFVRISKVKMQPKVAALDSLAKILGMFKADNEQGKDRLVIVKDFTGGEKGE